MPGLAGLGADAVFIGRSARDVLVELTSEPVVRDLKPNLGLLATVEGRGVIVTSQALVSGAEYVLRFFARDNPSGEDPDRFGPSAASGRTGPNASAPTGSSPGSSPAEAGCCGFITKAAAFASPVKR